MKKLSLLVISMVAVLPMAVHATKSTSTQPRLGCWLPNGGVPEKTPPTSPVKSEPSDKK